MLRSQSSKLTFQLFAAAGACVSLTSSVLAVTLERGDIVLVALNRIVHVAASNSQQTEIVDLPSFMNPWGIDVSSSGEIYVTDVRGLIGQPGRLLKIDPVTGSYSILIEGGFLVSPTDVAVLPDGDLVIADPGALGGVGAILRQKPDGMYVIASGAAFKQPAAVAPGAPGELFFLDLGGFEGGIDLPNAVYRLDLETLDTTLVSRGGLLQRGLFMTYAEGFLYLTEGTGMRGEGSIVRLDPVSGAQMTVTAGDLLTFPVSVAWRSAGCLAVAEQELPQLREAGVVCVNPTNGSQGRVTTRGFMAGLIDIAVFHGGQTPTQSTTWGSIKAKYR